MGGGTGRSVTPANPNERAQKQNKAEQSKVTQGWYKNILLFEVSFCGKVKNN